MNSAFEPASALEPFTFTYRNHRGEVSLRRTQPASIWFGTTDWHPEPQHFLKAFDLDKLADRDFALRDMLPVGGLAAEFARLQGRVQELLEANNRYLERARAAEAEEKRMAERYENWQPIETPPHQVLIDMGAQIHFFMPGEGEADGTWITRPWRERPPKATDWCLIVAPSGPWEDEA